MVTHAFPHSLMEPNPTVHLIPRTTHYNYPFAVPAIQMNVYHLHWTSKADELSTSCVRHVMGRIKRLKEPKYDMLTNPGPKMCDPMHNG